MFWSFEWTKAGSSLSISLMGGYRRFWSFSDLRQKVVWRLKVLGRHDLTCSSHPRYPQVLEACFGWVVTQRQVLRQFYRRFYITCPGPLLITSHSLPPSSGPGPCCPTSVFLPFGRLWASKFSLHTGYEPAPQHFVSWVSGQGATWFS